MFEKKMTAKELEDYSLALQIMQSSGGLSIPWQIVRKLIAHIHWCDGEIRDQKQYLDSYEEEVNDLRADIEYFEGQLEKIKSQIEW